MAELVKDLFVGMPWYMYLLLILAFGLMAKISAKWKDAEITIGRKKQINENEEEDDE